MLLSTISKSSAENSATMAEVTRLLSGRTRDIHLDANLRDLYWQRTWTRAAKAIRAWMIWVILLDVLTLGIYAIFLPEIMVATMLLPAAIIPPAAIAVLLIFRKPRPVWMQGLALLVGVFLILLSVSLVGVGAGGEYYERHLNVMLCVAITAIIIFPIPLWWTAIVGASAIGLYLGFQIQNPHLELVSVLAGTLFFASGIIATIIARRTMTILAQKTFLLGLRDRTRLSELASANERLELLAITDPLTGIANRRFMIEILDQLWQTDAASTGAAMLMCDIDEFKLLNDSMGHAEGDRCLVKIAGIIQSCVRDDRDLVARYGGEEFLVLLPGADKQGGISVAEQIRYRIEAASLPHPASLIAPHVTVSIGVACQPPGGPIMSPEQLQQQADKALYNAKRMGRNRVAVYEPAPTSM